MIRRAWAVVAVLAVGGTTGAEAGAGPEPVPDPELREMVREIRDMPASVDRAAVVTEAVRRRWIDSAQAARLLELIPPGCGRLEAALVLHGRIVDPENFYRVYSLFPDVGDQQALQRHGGRVADEQEPRVEADRLRAPEVPMDAAPPGASGDAETSSGTDASDTDVRARRIPRERRDPSGGATADEAGKTEEKAYVRIDVLEASGRRLENARIYFCGRGPLPAPASDVVRDDHWWTYGCELQVWVGNRKIYSEKFVPAAGKVFERRVRVEYY